MYYVLIHGMKIRKYIVIGRDQLEAVSQYQGYSYVIGWNVYHSIEDTVRDWLIGCVLYMYQILLIPNTIIKVTHVNTKKRKQINS